MTERLIEILAHEAESVPPADSEAPFLELHNPAIGAVDQARDTLIAFRITDTIYDVNSGVDMSKTVIKIKSGTGLYSTVYDGAAGGFQPGYAGTVSAVGANAYDVSIAPDSVFLGSTVITVAVHVQDTQTVVSNYADYAYSFTTIAQEASAPYLQAQSPEPSAVGVATDTNIIFEVVDDLLDPDSGVDLSTLLVQLRLTSTSAPVTAILGGSLQPGFTGSIDPIAGGYRITINPVALLSQVETITVIVTVSDTTPDANTASISYSFLTALNSVVVAQSDPGHMGPLEALSSAFGDELNDFGGGLETRLTARFEPAVSVQSGAGLLNAESLDGLTVTFPSGTLTDAVLPGQTFKLLSNLSRVSVRSADIVSVDSDSQITLAGSGIGEGFTGESWDILAQPSTIVFVESTHDFASEGAFILDGIVYTYSGKLGGAFLGVQSEAGLGAARVHDKETVLANYSYAFSAIEQLRNTFFLERAEGEDLSVIGDMLGVQRSEAWTDDVYRNILRAAAYAAAGVTPSLDNIAKAIFGVDKYTILPDFPRYPGIAFFAAERDLADQYIGKTFVEGCERVALNSDRLTFDMNADVVHATEMQVAAVTYADEPFPEGRVVSSGSSATLTVRLNYLSHGDVLIVTSAAAFTDVLAGDQFRIMSGPKAGKTFFVLAVTSSSSIILGSSRDGTCDTEYQTEADLSTYVSAASWKIDRPVSQFGYHLPSAEREISAAGVEPTWIFSSTAAESSAAISGSSIPGYTDPALLLNLNLADVIEYYHPARLGVDSDFAITADMYLASTSGLSPTDGRLFYFGAWVGDVKYDFGIFQSGSGFRIHLMNSSGVALAETSYGAVIPVGVPHTIQLVREANPDTHVASHVAKVFVDGRLHMTSTVYSSLASHSPTTDVPRITFGKKVASAGPQVHLRSLSWACRTPTDLYSRKIGIHSGYGGAQDEIYDGASSNLLVSGGSVRLIDYATNVSGGSGYGTFEFSEVINANRARIVSRTFKEASTSRAYSDVLFFGDLLPIQSNLARGGSIEILSGENAGTYVIDTLLDSMLAELPAATISPNSEFTLLEGVNAVRLVGADFITDASITWRYIPNLPNSTDAYIVIPNCGAQMGTVGSLSSLASTVVTPGTYEPALEVLYSNVPSATLTYTNDRIIQTGVSPIRYSQYPFYLFDSFGFAARELVSRFLPTGVKADFDSLFIDETGMHIAD